MFKRYRIDNYEIDFSRGSISGNYYLQVCRLDSEGRMVGGYSVLQPINSTGKETKGIVNSMLMYHCVKGSKPPRKIELFCEGLMAGLMAANEVVGEAAE